MGRKGKKEAFPEIKQEKDQEEEEENVQPTLSVEEIEEHDRDDREYFDTMPPGYRFVPTGEDLISYLKKKVFNLPMPPNRIRDANIYQNHPKHLTSMYKLHRGKEWYFFTPRTKKYPNGQRPDRAAGNGYWKATGADVPILDKEGVKIGKKKTLVYYEGKAKEKNTTKTDWIMHEYRIEDDNANHVDPDAKKDGKELDKCVLCMIYDKSSKEGPDANDNQQDDSNMMIVPANNREYPNQNPNGAGPIIPVQNGQVQSPNTNQGRDGANFYDTSPLLMKNVTVQNDNITQGLEGGHFHNRTSFENVQLPNPNITHGLDSEHFYNMVSGPYGGVFGNTASLHIGNNLYNTVGLQNGRMHMQNVQVPTHGLDSGPFNTTESGAMHNVQVPNSNIALGLQNGHFYNMQSGPSQNLQVPNSNIAHGLQNGCFYNMASYPYGGVFDNTASLHIQNNDGSVVANHLYDMVSLPMSNFDQGQNICATNGSYFQSWDNGHHVYNNQQGLGADPLEIMQIQNQNPMSQPSDYQSMGFGSEVTHHLDYAPSDHNLSHEDLHYEEPTEFLGYWAVSNHKDEEPRDCKDGQLGGPDQALSSIDKKG